MDDRSIVALYLRRDETAIRQTTEKYGSRLRTLAYGIVNDLQTAEECENDTYMEAVSSAKGEYACRETPLGKDKACVCGVSVECI